MGFGGMTVEFIWGGWISQFMYDVFCSAFLFNSQSAMEEKEKNQRRGTSSFSFGRGVVQQEMDRDRVAFSSHAFVFVPII